MTQTLGEILGRNAVLLLEKLQASQPWKKYKVGTAK
jgi:hypothetical protein